MSTAGDTIITKLIFTCSFAGSDTTAMALRSIIYYLIKNPRVYTTLMAEIDEAEKAGNLSEIITYKQGSDMKYLLVIIKADLCPY